MRSGDFSLMISTIVSLKESDMAWRFLSTLGARKEQYPDWIVGDTQSVLGRIDRHNNFLNQFKRSVKSYAKSIGSRERRYQLRSKLNDNETGILGALAIGARLKLKPGVSTRSALKKYIRKPLEEIASLPSVPRQLIAREQQALGQDN